MTIRDVMTSRSLLTARREDELGLAARMMVWGKRSPPEEDLMKVIVESIGQAGSRALLNGHELIYDQPTNVPGGENRGPSPLDVMVVSVAGCAHYYAAAYLMGRGFAPEGLTVEVEAEKGWVPLPRLAEIKLTIHPPAGLPQRHLTGIERAVKNCPAYGTLFDPPEVQVTVVPAEATGTASGGAA